MVLAPGLPSKDIGVDSTQFILLECFGRDWASKGGSGS